MNDAVAGMRVLVTGANRGIGRAIASTLAGAGARVALCGRDREALDRLRAEGVGEAVVVGDLERLDGIERVVDEAAQALGGLDALVNNAGVVEYAPVGAIARESLERQLSVNFTAPFLLAQRSAEIMRAAGGGVIVNVASTLAMEPAPSTAAYGASKAALVAMTKAFALELGASGVRVCAVVPGVVDTGMVRVPRTPPGAPQPEGAARDAEIDGQLDALRRLHPVGRLGTPQDVAGAVRYLLTASFATGTLLVVDGGLLLGQPG